MKTLYLECGMGAAGDMLTAALLELHDNREEMLQRINNIGLPGVIVTAEPSVKCGVTGTRVRVRINDAEEEADGHTHYTHGHGHLPDILRMIDGLHVSDRVKNDAKAVYGLIAEAESAVHGVPVGDVHFHEVGALDAVADVTACCMLMESLEPGIVHASPVAVGSGQVRCAHGLLPVPAPATERILRGVPVYSGSENGELCTPTGAALLTYFAANYGTMPVMTVHKCGYGMGFKDFKQANCVRAFWGETHTSDGTAESITELACNIDDMTPEAVAFAQQLLLDEGALDVYAAPIVMKKGRAGVQLVCLCRPADAERLTVLFFKHTTTLGLRVNEQRRFTLRREQRRVETPYGMVHVKTATGFGTEKAKPEYEDIAAIARAQGLTLAEAANLIK